MREFNSWLLNHITLEDMVEGAKFAIRDIPTELALKPIKFSLSSDHLLIQFSDLKEFVKVGLREIYEHSWADDLSFHEKDNSWYFGDHRVDEHDSRFLRDLFFNGTWNSWKWFKKYIDGSMIDSYEGNIQDVDLKLFRNKWLSNFEETLNS